MFRVCHELSIEAEEGRMDERKERPMFMTYQWGTREQTTSVAMGVVLNAPSKRLSAESKWSSRPTISSLHHQTLITIQHSFEYW
jgi:hypothetical protein